MSINDQADSLERNDRSAVSRRRFLQVLAATGAAVCFGGGLEPAASETIARTPPILKGNRFDLVIDSQVVDFTGHRTKAVSVNGSIPGPTLRWREGETVTIAVTNRLPAATSIHWHGIRVPAPMDGVPGVSFAGIPPGEKFVYEFPVLQNGTYWYHSHSGFQEQIGLAGALVIEPKDKDPIEYDREHVVLLSDWPKTDPETIYANLKKQSDYYNFHRRTAGTFAEDVRKGGLGATMADRLTWGRANMSPTDIADVTSAVYTYLVNGNPAQMNWTALFRPGERVRLRLINGSASTFFDFRLPGLPMTVVQSDGNPVQPVTVDEIRLGVAETYDVVVEPHADTAYTIFAQPESRGSYAGGTLAPRMGMTAPIPPLDPYPRRTMEDMGMSGKMKGMNKSGAPSGSMDMSGSKDGDMAGMTSVPRESSTASANDPKVGTTPFPQPGPYTQRLMPAGTMPTSLARTTEGEAPLRVGPGVVSVVKNASPRLQDPGDGLNGNGRRVLRYSDLRALYPGVDGRPPSREIVLHLTGNMERFIWGFDGYKFSQAEPIHLKLGERVRFVLINDTMMEHPMHLHGLWSEVENGAGEFYPYKHTVIVKPGERVSYLVSADTPGHWAFHCHLLYHLVAGMFRTVVVS